MYIFEIGTKIGTKILGTKILGTKIGTKKQPPTGKKESCFKCKKMQRDYQGEPQAPVILSMLYHGKELICKRN